MMPRRFRNSITSGVWNDRPKTSGMKMAKLSHSLSRRSGLKPSHSLNHSSASIALGMTKNSQITHADEEQAQADGQVDVDEAFLVRIQPGGDERPDLPEDPRAADDDAASPCRP